MDRAGFLRRHADLDSAVSLEFGALDKPVLDPQAPNVHFLDHLDTQALKRKYEVDPAVDKDRIVTVDYVWSGGGIRDAITDGRRFDLIVASHVFEHFANPVQWLLDVRSLLSADGKVFLALPDRRFTFDMIRRDTSLSEWVGWYLRKIDKPAAEQIYDHFAHVCHVAADRAWRDPDYRGPEPMFKRVQAIDLARSATEEERYVDAHCSVFTPFGFVELCRELVTLDLFPYRIVGFAPTEFDDMEFLAILQAHEAPSASRPGNAELQGMAVAAGYDGPFGGGAFARALETDAELAQRYRDLVAKAKEAELKQRSLHAASFPVLDSKLHHERPGLDDPRIPRQPADVGPWRRTLGFCRRWLHRCRGSAPTKSDTSAD